MQTLIDKLLNRHPLNETEIEKIFQHMLQGQLNDCQIASILSAWRILGEGTNELRVGALAMRRAATPLALPPSARPLVDNCGTGGDGLGSFNISTTAAVVAASCGAQVAKHGNRSVSSRCGSADLFFALDFPESLTPEAALLLLSETGFTFFFAPNFHPLMHSIMPVRKQLGIRTIFNLLGPLSNPLAPEYQLLGVGQHQYLKPMATTLATLGIKQGAVVHSHDGMDELSPSAPSDMILIKNGSLSELSIDPKEFGIWASPQELKGGEAQENAVIFHRILAGDTSGVGQAVVLNAAAVLWICEKVDSLGAGIKMAKLSIETQASKKFFQRWLQRAQELAIL